MQNKPPITKGSFSVEEFKKINDLRAAIEYFEDKIEGAGVKAITERVAAAKLILREFGGSTASVSVESGEESSTCISESSDEAQSVSADGYALPVTKKGINLPCDQATCHHDKTPAADLGIAPKWEGTPVYAIFDGEIYNYKYRPGFGKTAPAPEICKSFQLKGKDGWHYWYGHIMNVTVKNGDKVKAGQKIAEIGPERCADDTPPHLHIDRGSPKGSAGGSEDRRDPGFIPLLNKIYESTP
jgi:biotin carboxyl carrier protein